MDDRAQTLLETRRAEAVALLEANQAGRAHAGRTLMAALVATVAAALVANAADAWTVAIPLPAVVLTLLSTAFLQYADVTVIGAARASLERSVNEELGAPGLLYETFVAPVPKRPPLVGAVRLLQATGTLLTLVVVAVGTARALEQSGWIVAGYFVVTGVAAASAVASYRSMLQAGRVAAAALRDAPERG